jgi:hypothetical protein
VRCLSTGRQEEAARAPRHTKLVQPINYLTRVSLAPESERPNGETTIRNHHFHFRPSFSTFFTLPLVDTHCPTMSTVSLFTLLQSLRDCPDLGRIEPSRAVREKYTYTVTNMRDSTLEPLTLTFVCEPRNVPEIPELSQTATQCTVRGLLHNRRPVGLSGWHWNNQNEKSLTITCVNGCTPLDALDRLIEHVQAFDFGMLTSRSIQSFQFFARICGCHQRKSIPSVNR